MTDRRFNNSNPAGAIAAAIAATGTSVDTVADAAGITTTELESFLIGESDLPVVAAVMAGGFLHLTPTQLFEVAA